MGWAVEIGVWWVLLVAVWIATVNTFSVQEVIVAAVLSVPCAIAARAGRRAAGLCWTVRRGWLRWLLFLPSAIVHDTIAVLKLALRRRSGEDRDEFRALRLPAEDDPALRSGHAAVATAVLSATPGSVVVAADEAKGELLVHAVPDGETRLEREVRQP